MELGEVGDIERYCREVAQRARAASRALSSLPGSVKDAWLRRAAMVLRERRGEVLAANAEDVRQGRQAGLSAAVLDRLALDERRVEAMAQGLESVAALPDPIGDVIDGGRRPNGLEVRRIRVPLGVVFFIYESRPNVTVDASAICLKSGNAVILRGGKEAAHSSQVLVDLLAMAAEETGIPPFALQSVERRGHEVVGHFLKLSDWIDVAIPRGGESLIRRVVAEARMPVIKHYDGNCHIYVDSAADLDRALVIIENAKCQRPGVCNACESLLVHASIAETWLPRLEAHLVPRGVELRACPRALVHLDRAVAATDVDWRTEYLDLILSVKVVDSVDEAIHHIERFGSHHTDAILTQDVAAAKRFVDGVDSAAVMVNASTRFNDGGELGLGAEIGISTDKFHARGPCGLRELTSYKYVCVGEGQIRT